MPSPQPSIDDLLQQYPHAPRASDAKGNPSTLYLQWALGYAALQIAKSLQSIDRKSPNPDSSN